MRIKDLIYYVVCILALIMSVSLAAQAQESCESAYAPTWQLDTQTYMIEAKAAAAVGQNSDDHGDALSLADMLKYQLQSWEGKSLITSDLGLYLKKLSQKDWAWFGNALLFQKSYADLALEDVAVNKNRVCLKVVNKGGIPLPIQLTIYFEDGSEDLVYYDASVWENTSAMELAACYTKNISKITLGGKNIPDVNSKDNIYTI